MRKKGSLVSLGIVIGIAALATGAAAEVKVGKVYDPDIRNCGGFTTADAARILGVPAAAITASTYSPHLSFYMCDFKTGKRFIEFSIAVSARAEDALSDMERYRRDLELTAATDAFKDSLPNGAWSGIPKLGDEAVWSDINRSLRARQGNVILQVLAPAEKLDQIKVAEAFLKKL